VKKFTRVFGVAVLLLGLCFAPVGLDAAYTPAGTAVAPTNFTPADGCTIVRAPINITSATTTTLTDGTTTTGATASNYVKFYGIRFRIGSTGANTVTIEDTDGVDIEGPYDFQAGQSFFKEASPNIIWTSPISKGIQLLTTTAVPLRGYAYYTKCTTAP
jgi:hypothetical protein